VFRTVCASDKNLLGARFNIEWVFYPSQFKRFGRRYINIA